VARSYVDDVADVFDLNKHLAKAIALAVFVIAVYLIGKTFSLSRTSRRIGYLGILGLLIGHSLVLWRGTNDQKFTTSGESIKCYVITHEGEVHYGERPGIDPATGRPCRAVTPDLVYLLEEYKKGRQPRRITSTEPSFFDPRSDPRISAAKRDRSNKLTRRHSHFSMHSPVSLASGIGVARMANTSFTTIQGIINAQVNS
jgi:hypothetical protein